MFTRQQAWELLTSHMKNQNLIRHCLSVEAVMRSLADYFKEDKEIWGIVGLLHDGDYEETKHDTVRHAHTMASWLKEMGADEKIVNGILSHGWNLVEGCPMPSNKLEWSVYTCDELTGLIVAVALVRPDLPAQAGKKLATVTVDSVMKKWNVKAFAAGAKREQIVMCEEKLGIKLADFIQIALSAMQGISNELGL